MSADWYDTNCRSGLIFCLFGGHMMLIKLKLLTPISFFFGKCFGQQAYTSVKRIFISQTKIHLKCNLPSFRCHHFSRNVKTLLLRRVSLNTWKGIVVLTFLRKTHRNSIFHMMISRAKMRSVLMRKVCNQQHTDKKNNRDYKKHQ